MADAPMMGGDMAAPGPSDAAPADEGPTVLATIMQNPDGTFQLTKGDEPEPGAEGGAEGDAGAAQGQSFDAPGPLLKAVLDIIQGAQNAGEGSADDNFQKGFTGGSAPTPAPAKGPGPAERY